MAAVSVLAVLPSVLCVQYQCTACAKGDLLLSKMGGKCGIIIFLCILLFGGGELICGGFCGFLIFQKLLLRHLATNGRNKACQISIPSRI